MMKKIIIFLMILIMILPVVIAGSVEYQETVKLSTGDPPLIAVRFRVILTNQDCGKSICGIGTVSDGNIETWKVYDSPGSSVAGTCSIKSSTTDTVEICCSPPNSFSTQGDIIGCSHPLPEGSSGWSVSGIVNVYATGPMNYCYEKVTSTTWGKFFIGSKWCNYEVASECVSGGMINNEAHTNGYAGIINREDCGTIGQTCVDGECLPGCERREETYPKGGSVYHPGTMICFDSPYLSECQSDGAWKKVKECKFGCNEGSSSCILTSASRCSYKYRTGSGSLTITTVGSSSIKCLDAEKYYGSNYAGSTQIKNFVPGIYICNEGLWTLIAMCNNICVSSDECDTSEQVLTNSDLENTYNPETSDDTNYIEDETGYSVAPEEYFSLGDLIEAIIQFFKDLFT